MLLFCSVFQNGRKALKNRWELIQEALKGNIMSSCDLEVSKYLVFDLSETINMLHTPGPHCVMQI